MLNSRIYSFWLFLMSLTLFGCAGQQLRVEKVPQTMSFAAHAEAVFRRQNAATSQIMMLALDDVDAPEIYEALLKTEKNMQLACVDLTAYAVQSQTQSSASLMMRVRAGKSIYACELATSQLEKLLKTYDPTFFNVKLPSQ